MLTQKVARSLGTTILERIYLESAFSWLRFSPIALCNTFLSITDANTLKKGVVMLAAILYLLVINNKKDNT